MRNCNLVCRITYITYPNTFSVIPANVGITTKRPFRHLYPTCAGMTKRAFLNGFSFCAAVFGEIYATKSKPMSNERLLWVR